MGRQRNHEEITGVFDWERNVFQPDEPDERTVIGLLADGTTVKGKAKKGELERGGTYRFYGYWTEHPKYGRQFIWDTFTKAKPAGERGVIFYLSKAKGIGKKRARAIWGKYGAESLKMVREEPARVAADVAGLTLEVLTAASELFRQDEALEAVTIEVTNLLAARRFPRKLLASVIERWGNTAPEAIRENPYRLMVFKGVGFLLCDALYCELGLDPAAIERQMWCAKHALVSESDGSTWYPVAHVQRAIDRMIAGATVDVGAAIDRGKAESVLVDRIDGDARWVAEWRLAFAENSLGNCVHQCESESRGLQWPSADRIGGLWDHQRAEVSRALRGNLCILAGSPGTGKAQPMDAKILTPTGWVMMGEMKQGDLVIGGDGKPTKVLGIYPQGTLSVYRVCFSDGTSTECSADHLWFTTTRKERKTKKVGKVRDTATIRDTLDRGDGSLTNHLIPMVSPIEFEETQWTLHPYLIGMLLGDGGFRAGYATFSNPEPFLVDAVRQLLPRGVELRGTSSPIDYSITGRPETGNVVTEHLREMGLMGKMSVEKHIPHVYLFSSAINRQSLLQGLLDTDGYTDGHNVEFTTSSSQLADDFVFLVHSLGGAVSVAKRFPKYVYNGECRTGSLSHRILVKLPSDIAPFRLPRKRDSYIPKTKYPPRRYVVAVEEAGQKPCQCISVQNADGLYVTNDCIVTHNTFTLAKIIQAVGEGRSVVCAPTGKAAVRVTESLAKEGVGLRAKTIHSTLGVLSAEDGWSFDHNSANPLEERFIFVDEASMVDTSLACSLLSARAAGAHVLLVGDPDQLSPVGPGAPLRDLIAVGTPMGHLKEIHRNAGRIVRACAEIRDTHTFHWSEKIDLESKPPENLILLERAQPAGQIAELRGLLARVAGGQKWHPVNDCQVLCAVNDKSPLARKTLNRQMQEWLNPDGRRVTGNPFRVGDKIICLQNGLLPAEGAKQGGNVDANGKIYVANGEQARVETVEARYTVARLLAPDRLVRIPRGESRDDADTGCSWDLGYAISTHKSQGSEWPVVVVMLDAYPGAMRVCDRHWIYTAISRASELCVLIGKPETARAMCKRSQMWDRKTFLGEDILSLRAAGLEREWETALLEIETGV